MKSLFNEYCNYTEEANSLDVETRNATKEIFDKYFKLGFSAREIYYVMDQAIHMYELTTLLGWQVEEYKTKRRLHGKDIASE